MFVYAHTLNKNIHFKVLIKIFLEREKQCKVNSLVNQPTICLS